MTEKNAGWSVNVNWSSAWPAERLHSDKTSFNETKLEFGSPSIVIIANSFSDRGLIWTHIDSVQMDIEYLIRSYGYMAVLVGAFLEGETIVVLAAFAAHRGYLSLSEVILAAFWGSLAGDQLYFYFGRKHSRFFLNRKPSWTDRINKATRLLNRHQTWLILSFRFLYGLRTVLPFAIGMSSVSVGKYVLLNTVGAAIWAAVLGYGGYFFGHAFESVLGEAKKYELWAFSLIATVGILGWGLYSLRHRKRPDAGEKQDL